MWLTVEIIAIKEHIEKSEIKYPDFCENPDIFIEKICNDPKFGDFSGRKTLKPDIFNKKISITPIDFEVRLQISSIDGAQ